MIFNIHGDANVLPEGVPEDHKLADGSRLGRNEQTRIVATSSNSRLWTTPLTWGPRPGRRPWSRPWKGTYSTRRGLLGMHGREWQGHDGSRRRLGRRSPSTWWNGSGSTRSPDSGDAADGVAACFAIAKARGSAETATAQLEKHSHR